MTITPPTPESDTADKLHAAIGLAFEIRCRCANTPEIERELRAAKARLNALCADKEVRQGFMTWCQGHEHPDVLLGLLHKRWRWS